MRERLGGKEGPRQVNGGHMHERGGRARGGRGKRGCPGRRERKGGKGIVNDAFYASGSYLH